MVIILAVAWTIFQLEDYLKRVDMGIILSQLVAFIFALFTDLPKLGYITATDAFMSGDFAIPGAMALISVSFRRLQSSGREDRA